MSTDRRADGYNPEFDIDYQYGSQGELWVTSVIQALKEDRVEVKRDGQFAATGNLYVEFECFRRGRWQPSGIATTTTELYMFVLGDSETGFVIPTDRLRAICRPLYRAGRIGKERDGSHPTRGVLVKLSHVLAEIRRSDIGGRNRGDAA